MKIKKLAAGFFAGIVALTAVISASAETSKTFTEENTAFIAFAEDVDWKIAFWNNKIEEGGQPGVLKPENMKTVKITGNGEYMVAIDLSKGYETAWLDEESGENMIFDRAKTFNALGLQVVSTNEKLGMDVKKVIIDGKEMVLNGKSYTNQENKEERRTNIINGYVTDADSEAPGKVTIDGKLDGASAKLMDVSQVEEWQKMLVVFEVYGLDKDREPADASEATLEDGGAPLADATTVAETEAATDAATTEAAATTAAGTTAATTAATANTDGDNTLPIVIGVIAGVIVIAVIVVLVIKNKKK